MITGIIASQFDDPIENAGNMWPGGSLMAKLDFADNTYTVDGISYALADLCGGANFNASDRSVLGYRCDSSQPDAIGALLSAMQQYINGGLTFVFELERASTTAKINGPALWMYDGTDPNIGALNAIFLDAFAVTSGVRISDEASLFTGSVSGDVTLGTRNKIKYTLAYDNGDGTYKSAVSANASAAQSQNIIYSPNGYWAGLQLASFLGIGEFSSYFSGETYCRGIAIYGAVDSADLPALSVTFGAITDAGAADAGAFSDVKFLCAFDGVDGATAATDESNSAHSIVFSGNAQIDTAQSKFGGASLLLDGTGDYVSVVDTDPPIDFQFGNSPFVAEGWFRFNSLAVDCFLFGQEDNTPLQEVASWALMAMSDGSLQIRWSTNGTGVTTRNTVTGVVTTGVWYHIALERDKARRIRVYVNGVTKHSEVVHGSFFNTDRDMTIGARPDGGGLNGWIDEVRITKGKTQYASEAGFTPPSSPFPRS